MRLLAGKKGGHLLEMPPSFASQGHLCPSGRFAVLNGRLLSWRQIGPGGGREGGLIKSDARSRCSPSSSWLCKRMSSRRWVEESKREGFSKAGKATAVESHLVNSTSKVFACQCHLVNSKSKESSFGELKEQREFFW